LKNPDLDIVLGSIIASLNTSIDVKGYASLVVCGGRSPLPLYKKLSKIDIDWKKISSLNYNNIWLIFRQKKTETCSVFLVRFLRGLK